MWHSGRLKPVTLIEGAPDVGRISFFVVVVVVLVNRAGERVPLRTNARLSSNAQM